MLRQEMISRLRGSTLLLALFIWANAIGPVLCHAKAPAPGIEGAKSAFECRNALAVRFKTLPEDVDQQALERCLLGESPNGKSKQNKPVSQAPKNKNILDYLRDAEGEKEAKKSQDEFLILREKAEAGDAEAQFALGTRLSNGLNYDKDRKPTINYEGIYWLRRAANLGHVGAQAKVAQIDAEKSRANVDMPTARASPHNGNLVDLDAPEKTVTHPSPGPLDKLKEPLATVASIYDGDAKKARSTIDLTGTVVFWLLLILGMTGYLKMRSHEKETCSQATSLPSDGLIGIHGWLRFFVISLGILGPVLTFGRNAVGFQEAERTYAVLVNSGEWATYKTAVWLTLAAFSSFSIYAALQLRFIWKLPSVRLAKISVASWPVASVVIAFFIPKIVFPSGSILAAVDPQFIVSFVLQVFFTIVWIFYLSRSKRVRATYTSRSIDAGALNSEAGNLSTPNIVVSPVAELKSPDSTLEGVTRNDLEARGSSNQAFAIALEEVEGGNIDKGLWARLYSETGGNEAKTTARYIKLRAEQIA